MVTRQGDHDNAPQPAEALAAGRNDLAVLGQRLREARKARQLTLEQVAAASGVSHALVSKIENFRTIPSLPVLVRLAASLGMDLGDLLRGVGRDALPGYVVVRANERTPVEGRDEALGFQYEKLVSTLAGNTHFSAMVLTISPRSVRSPVTTEGDQFIFILAGAVKYTLGRDTLRLGPGDAVYFDGAIPHVPRCEGPRDAQILAIYLLTGATDTREPPRQGMPRPSRGSSPR